MIRSKYLVTWEEQGKFCSVELDCSLHAAKAFLAFEAVRNSRMDAFCTLSVYDDDGLVCWKKNAQGRRNRTWNNMS